MAQTPPRLLADCVMPTHWHLAVEHVPGPQTAAELAAVRRSVQRGRPFGEAPWSEETVRRLGWESPLRPQGRPKKHRNSA